MGPIALSGATADCQAGPSTDGGGGPVRYDPELAADGDPSTAWRCDGSGTGKTLTFSVAPGTQITEVGLVNGYAKVDPTTKANRYREYRRISEVRWTVGDATFTQELEDGAAALQTMTIPLQEAQEVSVTVTRSTAPGSKARTRNAVFVSEVALSGPR